MFKVLIVEDELLVRVGLKNTIDWARFGMVVSECVSNGRAALEYYEREKPDLIITDIKMPIMDGIELINRIREKDITTRIIILTCLQEFDLVKKALSLGVSNYILKLTMTEDEINEILEKVRKELYEKENLALRDKSKNRNNGSLKDELLSNYLFNYLYSEEEFKQEISVLNLKIHRESLLICILEIDNFEKIKVNFEDEKGALIKFCILNIVNEVLDISGVGEIFFENDVRYIIIFGFKQARKDIETYDEVLHILDTIKNSLSFIKEISLSFGVSSIKKGFSSLKAMYSEAIDALKMKFFGGSGVYIYNIIDQSNMEELKYDLEDKIARLLKVYTEIDNNDDVFYKSYETKITDIFSMIPSCTKIKLQEEFCQLFYWVASWLHIPNEVYFNIVNPYVRKVYTCITLDEIIECVYEYFNNLKSFLNIKSNLSNEISKALLYIEREYSNDISLRDVAKHVNLSPNYFSGLFKKELLVSFVDYLNNVRMDKAKELLLNTDMKAYEIAEKVGIKDDTYFSRIFKKVTGKSPKGFRNKWLREDLRNDEKLL